MKALRGAVLVLGLLVPAVGCGGDDAGGGPSPARSQLDWVLASGATATDEELAERFTASFLAQIPPDQVRQVLAGMAGGAVSEIVSESRIRVEAVVATGSGVPLTAQIVVEGDAPHRIAGLLFMPSELPDAPQTWSEVDSRLDELAARGAVLAAEVAEDGSLEVLHERGADAPAPLASMLKLYVLGAVVEAVAAGELGWDETVTVEEGDRSLGSGQQHETGAELTVQEAAGLMISVSDNTMTDVLLRLVGREAVEAQLAPQGMGEGSRARTLPFLTTREAFAVKWGERSSAYAAASEAERRDLLAGLDDPLPVLEDIDRDVPVEIDRIEWFATPREVAAAHLWLEERHGTDVGAPLAAILGSNPGLPVDPAVWVRGAFKGGTEPGVLAMSWLLERHDGRRFVLVLQASDPDRALDDLEGAAIAQGAMALLADV